MGSINLNFIVYIVIFISAFAGRGTSLHSVTCAGNRKSGETWCVANGRSNARKLQEALDYACGQGAADCRPIQPGAACYDPNTLEAHASWAFNSYYQKNNRGSGTCDFGGTAHVVARSPRYGNCAFPTRA